MKQQVKSKQRVADHGEVFTAEREVKAMCDLVNDETQQIFSRFLEPACGDGNFLAEILTRKLQCSQMKKYRKSAFEWEINSLMALGSLYGVDILQDNCEICRERLFDIWNKEYKRVCKKECNDDTRESAKFILKRNIVCGNALSLKCVDENGNDTDEPIVFSEWACVSGGLIKRSDFRFDVLLKENDDPDMYDTQMAMFSDDVNCTDYWMIDPITNEPIPKPIKDFSPIHYRRIAEYGN